MILTSGELLIAVPAGQRGSPLRSERFFPPPSEVRCARG
jgi:hypothetical protein